MVAERQLAVVSDNDPRDEWNDKRREFVRKAFCGGADDVTAGIFLALCERRRLSPEARHVYLINRAAKGNPPNWVIQTGIDGYRLIADRTGRYAGSDDPVFIHDPEGHVAIATVTVRKLVGGVVGSFTASARWDEYAGGGPMWTKMPHTLLAKCAEALALRKAFPEELSGLYTDTEMDQVELPANVAVSRAETKPKAVQATAAKVIEQSAEPEIVSWTVFWSKARAKKIDKDTFIDLVQKQPNEFANPQAAWDALLAAERGATQSSDPVDVEYIDVNQETGELPAWKPDRRQLAKIFAIAGKLGMTDEQAHQFAGVESMKDLDQEGYDGLISRLKALEAEQPDQANLAGVAPVDHYTS